MALDPDARFERCLHIVLAWEGGFSNNPADPGGATNFGITLATLQAHRQKKVTAEDVKAMTVEEAGAIYRKNYWDFVRGDELPPGVDLILFDEAVNQGPGHAIKDLQHSIGVGVDGVFGPATLQHVEQSDPVAIVHSIDDLRERFYRGLRTFHTFGKGWLNRLADVTAKAVAFAQET